MTAATYQSVDLPDASVVTTRALLTARENITDTVAARAMMCIHGGAGFGKTLAVNTCLHALEPGEDVRKITFRARPTARAVRYELFTALDLAGEPPRHPSEFDRLLKTALAERPRTFLVDAGTSRTGQCGTGVGGQLGPGAEVAVGGVAVGEGDVVGVGAGPDRVEQGDGLEDLAGSEAGEVLPDEDAGGEHRFAA